MNTVTTFEISVENMTSEASNAFYEAVEDFMLSHGDLGFAVSSVKQTDDEIEEESQDDHG